MSTSKKTNKKGKKTIGGMITTVLATIIVIIAYLFGWGGNDAEDVSENALNNASDSQVISEEYETEDEDPGEQEDEDEEAYADAEDEETDFLEEEVQAEEETVVSDEEDEVYAEQEEEVSEPAAEEDLEEEITVAEITFRNQYLLDQHYEKHGIEMGFASAEEYELAAYKVTIHPDTLHKIEAEDGDDVYYREETNEFVVVSTDGYIRTYFNPSGGIDYYNRQ